jgi:hypothetical protein
VVRRGEQILREVAANSHALLAFFALSNADVVVARVVLDDHVAGLYAGGLILIVVAAIGVLASLGAVLFSDLAVAFVGGPAYAEIEPLVGLFAALGMVLAMIQLMVYEVVARQHRASVWVLWAGMVAVAGTAAYVTSEGSLLVSVAAIDVTVLLVLVVTALLHRAAPEPDGEPAAGQ